MADFDEENLANLESGGSVNHREIIFGRDELGLPIFGKRNETAGIKPPNLFIDKLKGIQLETPQVFDNIPLRKSVFGPNVQLKEHITSPKNGDDDNSAKAKSWSQVVKDSTCQAIPDASLDYIPLSKGAKIISTLMRC